MLMWLLPAALAGSLVEEMDAIVLARQPTVAMACTPTSAVLEGVSDLTSVPMVSARLGDSRIASLLASPDQLKALGVTEDGVWSLVLLPMEISAEIPFSGTPDQAASLLGEIVGPDGLRRTKEGWTLEGGLLNGEARQEKHALLLDISAAFLQIPGGPARPALLKGLPDVDGCLVYASIAKPPPKVPVDGLSMQFPAGGELVQLRMHTTKAPPESLKHTRGKAPRMATVAAPTAVIVTSADLLDLFSDLPDIGLSAEQQAQVARANRRVSVGSGAAVAIFGDKSRIAVSVPLRGRLGLKLSKRKVKKGMDAMDDKLVWTDKDRFTVGVQGESMVGHVRRGEVVMASDTGLLSELIAGEGTPWVSEASAEWLRSYPVVMEVKSLEKFDLPKGQVVRVGVGASEDVWTVQASIPKGLGDSVGDMGDRRRGDPDFKLGARPRQPRMELEENLNEIYTAELAYDAAFDEFVPAEPAPRPLNALTAEPIPWVGSTGFNTLGIRPDGLVRGTWWVEVSPDGSSFTVYGAIDEDGDGKPAQIKREKDHEIERLTPEGVR